MLRQHWNRNCIKSTFSCGGSHLTVEPTNTVTRHFVLYREVVLPSEVKNCTRIKKNDRLGPQNDVSFIVRFFPIVSFIGGSNVYGCVSFNGFLHE